MASRSRRFEADDELATLARLRSREQEASRRINALERVLIQGLERQIARIEMALEEREREAIGRLKRFKAKREETHGECPTGHPRHPEHDDDRFLRTIALTRVVRNRTI